MMDHQDHLVMNLFYLYLIPIQSLSNPYSIPIQSLSNPYLLPHHKDHLVMNLFYLLCGAGLLTVLVSCEEVVGEL